MLDKLLLGLTFNERGTRVTDQRIYKKLKDREK